MGSTTARSGGDSRGGTTPAIRSARGFTLIELLVVLIIVGVIVGLATLTLGDNRDETVEREARRLHALLGIAADEAVIGARALGLQVAPDGYRFLVAARDDDESWRVLEQDRALHAREVPPVVNLEILVEGLPNAATDPSASGEDDDDAMRPHVVLFPSGELIPFQLIVRGDDYGGPYWLLEGDLDGTVTLDRQGGDE